MTPRELKQAMKERKRELKEQLDANPLVQRARRKRRIRRAVLSAAALVLALLARCECGEGLPPVPAVPDAGVRDAGVQASKPPPVVKVKVPLQGKVAAQPRPELGPQQPASPGWLDELRMQVAARSPRLAECFTGVENPGAIRWSASVNPGSGTVSDHELAPAGAGAELTNEQRTCLLGVLSSPQYKLSLPGSTGLPNRVSLVIEF